jgi:DNA-binding PadR family transcriptional regulator
MREQTYFILAVLLDGPRHGYAIIKQVEELSGNSVHLAAGTLYAALDRLNTAGLIETVREEIVNGRSRRYYALTPEGETAVRTEAARMATAARVVTDRTQQRAARSFGGVGGGAEVQPA